MYIDLILEFPSAMAACQKLIPMLFGYVYVFSMQLSNAVSRIDLDGQNIIVSFPILVVTSVILYQRSARRSCSQCPSFGLMEEFLSLQGRGATQTTKTR